MKQIARLLLIVSCFFGFSNLKAQEFELGDALVNATIGYFSKDFNNDATNTGYNHTYPALVISTEYCLLDNIGYAGGSIGAGWYLGFSGSNYTIKDTSVNYLYIIPAGQVVYHYYSDLDIELYSGVRLGYKFVSQRDDVTIPPWQEPIDSEFYFSVFVGARYYFSDNWAAVLELNLNGVGIISAGATYRF